MVIALPRSNRLLISQLQPPSEPRKRKSVTASTFFPSICHDVMGLKWLSMAALESAEERRKAKSKGERERYTQLNAEFQRIPRRDKKDFFNEQCNEVEENNKTGRLEISSRKLEILREHFKRWAQ